MRSVGLVCCFSDDSFHALPCGRKAAHTQALKQELEELHAALYGNTAQTTTSGLGHHLKVP